MKESLTSELSNQILCLSPEIRVVSVTVLPHQHVLKPHVSLELSISVIWICFIKSKVVNLTIMPSKFSIYHSIISQKSC